ncbi:MAG: hypothetical protein MR673_03565 [Fusobacterium perfoetens]|uniref:hypothetical protein n=1 Tax=Fusobacterium perfoetens TaxID=852 RepID=UPI0023F1084A|nr:hypothetical protein [Fusobacterium perfoetens]MCI6152188.1 hypothetical protein [Fusobacterium perfoetens]MDY3237921.1 hypothetical protein [Fusobacterium perfoetens]
MRRYLQIFSGGFAKQEVKIEELKSKLEKILKLIKIDGLIIGWYENKEFYNILKNFLETYGVKLYFWLPLFSELSYFGKFSEVRDYKGNEIEKFSFQEGENFEFYCPNNMENIENIKRIFDEKISKYNVDGIFIDKIRYPAFSNGNDAIFTCFCEKCVEDMKKYGINIEELKKYIENSFNKKNGNPLEIKQYKEFKYEFENENLDKYFKFKNQSIFDKVQELTNYFRKKGFEVGFDIYAPNISYLFGQDINKLSEIADFIKPMYYRKTFAPAGIPFELQKYGELYDEKAKKYLLELIGEKYLEDNISNEQMLREIKEISKKYKNIYIGIDFNKKDGIALSNPEYIEEVMNILHEGNSEGIVLSWDFMSIPEEHIEIFLKKEAINE